MSDEKFHFGEEFQIRILQEMVQDQSFCDDLLHHIRPEFFANQYLAWFCETIIKLMKEYKTPPTKLKLDTEVRRFHKEKQDPYWNVFNKVFDKMVRKDSEYMREQLKRFIKRSILVDMNKLLIANQNKHEDDLVEIAQNQFDKLGTFSIKKTKIQSLHHVPQMMEESSMSDEQKIPTYLPTIDKALDGGIDRGTLTVGLSGTNVGKSIFLVNWTYHLIMNGYKVFYVSLEGFEKQTMFRLISRAIGEPVTNIAHNMISDEFRQKMNDFIDRCAPLIKVHHNSTYGFTVEDFVDLATKQKHEFDFDVLIVDYGQILKTRQKFNDLRHQQAEVHRTLAKISGPETLNCATITVAQGTRETQEKMEKGMLVRKQDMSECFEITRTADNILTLNKSSVDQSCNTIRFLLDKSRDGVNGQIEYCKTNFNRMALYGSVEEGLGFMTNSDYRQMTGIK